MLSGWIETQWKQDHKITHFQNPKPATKYPLDMTKHMKAVKVLLPKFSNKWSLHLNVLSQVAEVLKNYFDWIMTIKIPPNIL